MIFNNDLIYIHIGKTGGISCSRYLLENLQRPVFNCHRTADSEANGLDKTEGVVPLTNTHRHWSLEQSLKYIKNFNGKDLQDFSTVVAVVRNPVTLEFSFYNHMQKSHVRQQRGEAAQILFDLSDGPFSEFVRHSGYHTPGLSQDDYLRVDGNIPNNVHLVKFEKIEPEFVDAVTPYLRPGASKKFYRINTTDYGKTRMKFSDCFDDNAREAIYEKHQYMFDSGLYSINVN